MSNPKYCPYDLLSRNAKTMKRGESISTSFQGLTALMWKDSKHVYFQSFIHDACMCEPITRNTKKDGIYEQVQIQCRMYIGKMAVVDKSDEQSAVKKDKKQKMYCMRIFISFLGKTINNAYCVCN